MHSSFKVPPEHFNQVEVWTGTGTSHDYYILVLFFFSRSAPDLLMCLGSLSCCLIKLFQAAVSGQVTSYLTREFFGI